MMRPVVVATPDVVGRRMAGPAIRALELARQLARHFPTQLVASVGEEADTAIGFPLLDVGSAAARDALRDAAVIVSQPTRKVLHSIRPSQRAVFDLFDPVLLELDELYGRRPTPRQRLHRFMEGKRLERALRRADLLLAGAPRQIDYYEEFARQRGVTIRPASAWEVIPFGAEDLRRPDVEPESPPIVVWNGGMWSWLDSGSAIAAVESLNESGFRCRLLFLGARRPGRPATGGATPAASSVVEFHEEWVPYGERAFWLARCKVAIMLHRRTAEAEFSIRTRLFDAIGAGLPVVATRGGYAAELVERHGLGIVVEPDDVAGIRVAVERLLGDDVFRLECVNRMSAVAETFRWERVVQPLVDRIRDWQETG